MQTKLSRTIVWGASGGVGLAAAKKLCHKGQGVIAYARDIEDEGLTILAKQFPNLIIRQFEIREEFYEEEKVYLQKAGFKIDGMVDCVGSSRSAPEASMSERLDDMMKPNLYHQYFATLTFKDILAPGASVVFLSSIRALTGTDNQNIEYAFAKAALENMTKSLTYMLSARRIRVNCIRPTPIIGTKISANWPAQMIDTLTEKSVYGKLLNADEVADVILFLLSDASRSITGSAIDVSNGFLPI